jgi:hypothetical protein
MFVTLARQSLSPLKPRIDEHNIVPIDEVMIAFHGRNVRDNDLKDELQFYGIRYCCCAIPHPLLDANQRNRAELFADDRTLLESDHDGAHCLGRRRTTGRPSASRELQQAP